MKKLTLYLHQIKKIIDELKDIKSEKERFKNAYFWRSPSSASGRRSYEEQNSQNWNLLGVKLEIKCSAKNIYVQWSHTWNEILTLAKQKTELSRSEIEKEL